MGKFQRNLLYIVLSLVLLGCTVNVGVLSTGLTDSESDAQAKIEVQSVYSGLSESDNKGAPVFEFLGPTNISNLKLYTDANCHTELSSANHFDGTKYVLRDTESENRNRVGEYSYYAEYTYNGNTYCQFLSKYTHDPVYIVSVLADDTRRGLYLGVDNKGNVKLMNTNTSAVPLSASVGFEIEKTVKNPKKLFLLLLLILNFKTSSDACACH